MRKQTKADRILNNSAMRLEATRLREQLAQSQLNTAKALREAAEEAHNALTRELAPTPRKAAKKAAGGAAAPKEPASSQAPGAETTSGAECVAIVPTLNIPCTYPKDHEIHDPNGGYASYHEFEGPKPVARAPRKSRQKSEAALSDQSSGTVADSAGVAASAASGD